jgi:hypothetical protein
MTRPSEKHTPYFELLESLQAAKGCVLCELRSRSTRRYVDSLFYESVNDPGLRSKLVSSRGFCLLHTEILLNYGDGLGAALLYQDQVRKALDFFDGLREMSEKDLRKKARPQWERHGPCPLCEQERATDALRIDLLLTNLRDPEMARALESSPGLCLPHLLSALEVSRDSEAQRDLLEIHRVKFARLLDELKEFIRKHDYRHSAEPYGPEADVWQRAPRMLLGNR